MRIEEKDEGKNEESKDMVEALAEFGGGVGRE